MTDLDPNTVRTDLDDRLAAYDIAPYAPHLPDADISYARHECALGTLVLAVASGGPVVACSFDVEDDVADRIARRLSPRVLRQPKRLDGVRRELDDYLLGRRTSFDSTVDLA